MSGWLMQTWLGRGALARLLWPLSQLYRAAEASRRALYRLGWLRVERLPVPVIVVGNVVAGGAGKTPLVMAVVAHLQARGWQPGVISRGHGRRGGACLEVLPGLDAAQCGDEPLLMARRTAAPVFVAAQRVQAARALLSAHPQVDILVADDGLQHLHAAASGTRLRCQPAGHIDRHVPAPAAHHAAHAAGQHDIGQSLACAHLSLRPAGRVQPGRGPPEW